MRIDSSSDWHGARLWAQTEFGAVALPDRRLRARLVEIAAAFMAQPTQSIPQACGAFSQAKAAYRFFANDAVSAGALLQGHLAQTIIRAGAQPVVLIAQDTTSLTYGPRAGLGLVGGHEADGLWLHSSMAFNPQGCALGLAHVEYWTRDPAQFGKARARHTRVQAEKESQRWLNSFLACVEFAAQLPPATRVINLADREGDIYQLFALADQHRRVNALVRARHDRHSVEGRKLSEILAALPPASVVPVQVPRRPGQKARVAQVEVRFAAADIAPPQRQAQSAAVKLYVVEARENRADKSSAAIDWRLLTNIAVENPETAIELISHYRVRWQIEEYHRTLKSGCQAQARQLEEAERLEKILMIDLVVAWRTLELSRLARASSPPPVEEHFTADELAVLGALAGQQVRGGQAPGDLREAVRRVAQLGGFLARKGDGEPGAMTLWRGLERLSALVAGWVLAKKCG
jgi:hypothetical protein